jgi:hypothetical protein
LLIRDLALRKGISQAMADDCTLAMLRGTTLRACSAMGIVHQYQLALSSVYRRIGEFVDSGVLTVERIVVTEDGKRYSRHRSTIRDIRAEYKGGELELSFSPNEDVVSKLTRMWSTMRVER